MMHACKRCGKNFGTNIGKRELDLPGGGAELNQLPTLTSEEKGGLVGCNGGGGARERLEDLDAALLSGNPDANSCVVGA